MCIDRCAIFRHDRQHEQNITFQQHDFIFEFDKSENNAALSTKKHPTSTNTNTTQRLTYLRCWWVKCYAINTAKMVS